MSCVFLFVDDKVTVDFFKDEIRTFIKAKYRLKFFQDLVMNHVSDQVKPRFKIQYKLTEEQYSYDILFDISLFPTLIKLTYFLGWIQHFVTVIGKWVFESNIPFALHINCGYLDYCFTYDDLKKVNNGYKGVLKYFFFIEKNMCLFQK